METKKKKIDLLKDIAAYRKSKIQTKKAKKNFRKMFEGNSTLFSDMYLGEIALVVAQYRNFDLFQYILTKERDTKEQFNNMLKITNQNIKQIFKTINIECLDEIRAIVLKQGLIQARIPKASKKQ